MIFVFVISPKITYAELIPEKVIIQSEKKYNQKSKNRFNYINKNILKSLGSYSDLKKLNIVNTWFNAITPKDDIDIYGVNDYWATLYEFVGKGKGDCEDYTISKYYVLKELGFDLKRLKFTYVVYKSSDGKNTSHMVLVYFKKVRPKTIDDILILDNLNHLILPPSKRPNIVKIVKMINGDTGAKSKKWKQLEINMKNFKL